MYANKAKWLMTTMALFFTQILMAQQTTNNYPAQWKKVESLEAKGLTKSAREEVVKIYDLAVKEKQEAQQIKSCFYLIKYRNMVEEDSHENNIFFVDTLIDKAKAPAKNLLQSLQAEMFWQYLQHNRWRFYNRTKLEEEKSKDITTWSINKIHSTIAALYKASLQNDAVLKSNGLSNYEAILLKGKNTRQLRPTLYDFLAHRALEYYINDERDITKPAYAFVINDPNALARAADFVKNGFKTRDTASLYYKALLLMQDLLRFHQADNTPDGLLDADLIRLSFVHEKGVMENKNKLYENALQEIENKYSSSSGSAQAAFLRAQLYHQQGQQYNPQSNSNHQYEIKRAKEICESVVKKFPASEGGINCHNLLGQILHPILNLQTEQVNPIGQPFRSLVQYKNIPKLYLRIIKTSQEELRRMNRRDYDGLWTELVKQKALKEWTVQLPDLQDYQQHSTEIKTDALESGIYLLVASRNENFALAGNILTKQVLYISNLSYIFSKNEYHVLHRDNGQPMPGTKVQVWESKYNYNTSQYDNNKGELYTTDANGRFMMKESKDYRNVSLQLINGKDELFLEDNVNVYSSYEDKEQTKNSTFLFTDRSIYRPGQTVYFKGIVVSSSPGKKETRPVPGFKGTVILKNANYETVKELNVTTNSNGSFNGSFKLPEGVLNGQFSIVEKNTNSTQTFSVEEYKRPKFFTEIQKPKGTYRLNDSVKVTGTAKAYAGNNVDGAKVKYRVTRQVRYPDWWGYYSYGRSRPWPGRSSTGMEITNGETITNAKGEFTVTFKAIADETVDKKDQPTFYYEVSADVTDINGETRSGSTSVAVAYQMLQLNIVADNKMPVDSLKKLTIQSTNMNGLQEPATAILSIEKLKHPGRIFRERLWDQPDQFVMSRDEYYSHFPHDIYKDENQLGQYASAGSVLEKTDSTNKPMPIDGRTLGAGWYKLTATTRDKYGEEVKAIKYIQLTSDADKVYAPAELTVSKRTLEPGEKLQYFLNSGFGKLWLLHTRNRMNEKAATSYEALDGRAKMFEVPVTEADRGGIYAGYAFVRHNRVYNGGESANIPWSNKELNITYQTFRDKLLPGAKEEWKVKISGSKGEKLAAEMLTAMYDASLDQFRPHNWNSLQGLWPTLGERAYWYANGFRLSESQERDGITDKYKSYEKQYDRLGVTLANNEEQPIDWVFGAFDQYRSRDLRMAMPSAAPMEDKAVLNEVVVTQAAGFAKKVAPGKSAEADLEREKKKDTVAPAPQTGNNEVQVRKNFNETAFFFPDLQTDAEGNVSFSFTMPEALTQWKLMTLAHTNELASGYTTQTVVTQKPLMVQPNAPRFMREGDRMELSAKVVNLTDKEITGQATLELLDAATGKPVDGWFKNMFPAQYFTAPAGQSAAVKFPMEIPFNYNSALTYRIIAKADNASDGEEAALPVLTNRMLVTESMPLNLRQTNQKSFSFTKLLNSGSSSSLHHHALTVEFTSNPAWYAVQALPYLMEYPYECAEQTFNRYYANALATYISNSMPRIKTVFDKWKTLDTAALQSNLQKNEELKNALLQETPWVMDAQNENQQKKNIALLFDMVKMGSEMNKAMGKLRELQSSNGGFVWFKGGPDDRYMTQYIITGIGHLRKLNALDKEAYTSVQTIVNKAVPYLDAKIKEEYDYLIKYKVKLSSNNLSYMAIQYLYMRSFFPEYKINSASTTAVKYYIGQAQKYWLSQGKYMQAMIGLALHRSGDVKTPAAIVKSLLENAIVKEEMGMYWKEFATGGYYWHQSPIESQAMMVELFTDVDKNTARVDDLKTWLLKNKQTTNWKTTRATAEACYALLLGGSNWLSSEPAINIQAGDKTFSSNDQTAEAGTGYFKQRLESSKVKPAMGNITVTRSYPAGQQPATPQTAWGAVYWQYFEDLDKITPAATPLQLTKKLFVETNSDRGPVLKAIKDGDAVKVGDKIKVRIELKVDRDMEYVHMKDMRGACMEPVNVLSGYKWQGGLGYYETTKDASTNFFFGWLARGTYVFEYPLFVTHTGNFSNGITTIQCMYAPEFTSHSEGVRVSVE